jgi:hypothetical protein
MERSSKGQFIKGKTPWNKGKKGVNGKSDTVFTKGEHHTGEAHITWGGGVQVMKKDCTYLWDGTGKRARRPRVAYEETFGPIPEGNVIIHIDGNRYNDEPKNLLAISRSENLKRNSNKK